jgi:hypothetical protein
MERNGRGLEFVQPAGADRIVDKIEEPIASPDNFVGLRSELSAKFQARTYDC